MRIQLIILFLIFANHVYAVSDKDINELFKKYEEIMINKKADKIDEVFSKKFFKNEKEKKEFIENLKAHKSTPEEKKMFDKITWKKGTKDEIYFVKLGQDADSQFIITNENGKLKINGTMNDAD